MLEALTQNSTDVTSIKLALDNIALSLRFVVYIGLVVSVLYCGNTINNWDQFREQVIKNTLQNNLELDESLQLYELVMMEIALDVFMDAI